MSEAKDGSASEPDEDRYTQSLSGTGQLRRALPLISSVAIVAALGIAAFASYEVLEARDDLREANELIDRLEEQADTHEADADLLVDTAVALDGRVSDLESEVGGLTDFGGVVSTVDDLNTRVADLEPEVDGFGAPVGFGSRIDDLESDVGCLDRALSDVAFNWARTSYFYSGASRPS
jgi:hypothetical protein